MKKIVKIVIKGESGYCSADDAFHDKVTLEENRISYEYLPMFPSEHNKEKKWSFKTSNPFFKTVYDHVCEMIPDALNIDLDICYTDIGAIDFIITYDDKSKDKKQFFVLGDDFGMLFKTIKQLVPVVEDIPVALRSEEDWESLYKAD